MRNTCLNMVYELANPQAPRAEWQRKPLANVYVVITWTVIIPAPAHAISSCQHSEIARHIAVLWHTDDVRKRKPTAIDEVRAAPDRIELSEVAGEQFQNGAGGCLGLWRE